MAKTFLQSLRIFLVLTGVTGLLYPALVTLISQGIFFEQAQGSLLKRGDTVAGSKLISQKFEDARYFWSRPSSGDFATVASGASNLGPTSHALQEAVEARAKKVREAHHLGALAPIPPDMLFASGSGLDPHISLEAAELQIERVASARSYNPEQVQKLRQLVKEQTESRQWGLLGEPRVNVLALNMAVDDLK